MSEPVPPVEPHGLSAEAVAASLAVDLATGLTAAEVTARRDRFGPNLLRQHARASLLGIVLNQFRSPVVYLLVAAAILALAFREWIDGLAILAVLVINGAIGTVTEMRAVRSMEALRHLSARSVQVRRGGAAEVIPAEDLVPGDIVILDAGDVVTADLRVLESANLASDESALTGESLPVAKAPEPNAAETPLAERTAMLFKGCAITRGTGAGLAVATGMATELGRVTRLVEESEPERSPLEHQLQRLSRDLIWATLAIAAAVAIAGIVAGGEIALMVETAVALAVAAIPEGLPIVATLALARGMLRMARRNALIERLSAVETLGATTIILTDKTGTLTENRMHVDRLVIAAGEIDFDHGSGRFTLGGRDLAVRGDTTLAALLRAAALCNNAAFMDDGSGVGDPMEVALLELARAGGLSQPELLADHVEIAEHAFDTRTKMMATVHQQGDGVLVAVKGAPEAVFSHVAQLDRDGRKLPFDNAEARRWHGICDLLAEQGLRLLAIAGRTLAAAPEEPYRDLTLYGIVAFQDPPRPDVAAALADARRAGIRVVMVTGDHPRTAKSISAALGLTKADARVMHGSDLGTLADLDDSGRQAIRETDLFSRVTPEQKLDLVALHQSAGEVVAMTGDGVNDAPALKKAEIGIAMGQRGTQVAREAADMVLRDDAFSTIVHAIGEGRIIYTNIRRFTTYLLSCNLSEILVIGLAVGSGLPLPLLPLQILFLNLVTDVFPALSLGTIEADRDVLARPPRNPKEPIMARAQWLAVIVHGAVIAGVTLAALGLGLFIFGLTGDALTTICFFTLALAQLWHVFSMRNWRDPLLINALTRNPYVWLAIALCLAILALAGLEPHLAGVLHIVPLPGNAWMAVLALSVVPVMLRQVGAIVTRIRRAD